MPVLRHALLALSLLTATPSAVPASEFPAGPVRIVVPYPAGGPSDTSARLLADPLSRQLGQPVVVENRSGGSGQIGTEAALRNPHDGYTLLLGGVATFVLLPAVKPDLYNVTTDMIPLTQLWSAPQVLAVRKDLPVGSVAELVDYGRQNPGKLTFGSAGTGSITHLAIMLFENEAKVSVTHVPYRSTALWLADAAGNRIDGGFGDIGTLMPHLQAGSIKPLMISVPKRNPRLAEVPTSTEAGLPGVQTQNWFGLAALGKTPPQVVDRLRKAVAAAQADPAYLAGLKKVGGDIGQPGHEPFGRLIAEDVSRFGPIMRAVSAPQK
jgi:tripartite-type tricarboxylate transporter receptor subunit TctC